MTMPDPQLLTSRAIISVSGADAESFLNGLLTVSTIKIVESENRYGALLTPQGKIIADMLITRQGDAILLDCDSAAAPHLVQRLSLFRLRALVAVKECRDLGVIAFEGTPDPRDPSAPRRRIALRASCPSGDAGQYHAARIAAGLAEQGADFGPEELFPADINMDLVGGVDFKKGCFLGQEVVSRMKRRGTARRRTLKAKVTPGTQPGPILANGFEIGRLTSVFGAAALARVRIDRLAQAQAKGETVGASQGPVILDTPPWLAEELAAIAEPRA